MAEAARVFHEECNSDDVKWDLPEECGCPWEFVCRKCRTRALVLSILDAKLKMTETALDGQERVIENEIRVIPKR